jgi:hypothetical protein
MKDLFEDENLLSMAKEGGTLLNPILRASAVKQVQGIMEGQGIAFTKNNLKAFISGILFIEGVIHKMNEMPFINEKLKVNGNLTTTSMTVAILMNVALGMEKGAEASSDKLNTTHI